MGWLANSTQYQAAVDRLDCIQFFAEAKVTFEEPVEPVKMNPPAGAMDIPNFAAKSGKK